MKSTRFVDVWPQMLETHHITKTELGRIAWGLKVSGEIRITNANPGQRTAHDEHLLSSR